jgi:hypothetical protein
MIRGNLSIDGVPLAKRSRRHDSCQPDARFPRNEFPM